MHSSCIVTIPQSLYAVFSFICVRVDIMPIIAGDTYSMGLRFQSLIIIASTNTYTKCCDDCTDVGEVGASYVPPNFIIVATLIVAFLIRRARTCSFDDKEYLSTNLLCTDRCLCGLLCCTSDDRVILRLLNEEPLVTTSENCGPRPKRTK